MQASNGLDPGFYDRSLGMAWQKENSTRVLEAAKKIYQEPHCNLEGHKVYILGCKPEEADVICIAEEHNLSDISDKIALAVAKNGDVILVEGDESPDRIDLKKYVWEHHRITLLKQHPGFFWDLKEGVAHLREREAELIKQRDNIDGVMDNFDSQRILRPLSWNEKKEYNEVVIASKLISIDFLTNSNDEFAKRQAHMLETTEKHKQRRRIVIGGSSHFPIPCYMADREKSILLEDTAKFFEQSKTCTLVPDKVVASIVNRSQKNIDESQGTKRLLQDLSMRLNHLYHSCFDGAWVDVLESKYPGFDPSDNRYSEIIDKIKCDIYRYYDLTASINPLISIKEVLHRASMKELDDVTVILTAYEYLKIQTPSPDLKKALSPDVPDAADCLWKVYFNILNTKKSDGELTQGKVDYGPLGQSYYYDRNEIESMWSHRLDLIISRLDQQTTTLENSLGLYKNRLSVLTILQQTAFAIDGILLFNDADQVNHETIRNAWQMIPEYVQEDVKERLGETWPLLEEILKTSTDPLCQHQMPLTDAVTQYKDD